MNLGQILARIFGPATAGAASPMAQNGQNDSSSGQAAGRTSLDRLMATPDKLDRIAPPSIAQAYGTSWQNLARINGLGAAEQLQIGAMLRLPAQDGAAAAGANALPNTAPIAGEIPVGNTAMPGVMGQSSSSGLTSVAGISIAPPAPATAQIAAPSGTGTIHTNPDGKQAEDFMTRHRWPCTTCGRTGKAAPLRIS
jgi:hypothetical protein